MSDEADVRRGGERVGGITRTPRGSTFGFDDAFWREHSGRSGGIAVHLPYSRRTTEVHGVNLHPYFAGLLPEGLRLRALVRRTKTSEDDLLGLLLASGADCIGDLSVVPRDRPPLEAVPSADVQRLEEEDFGELLRRSLAYGADRMEPSLPGVQEKISAGVISFPLRARKGPRACILKLNPPDKPSLVQNEEFFLRMAADCGLAVAPAKLVRDRRGTAGLLVERFDRRVDSATGRLAALHQEDACQFLDRYPADKYRLSCAEIAEGLSVCSAPVVEVARFIRLVAFSYLIGNGDLHAKNVSILGLAPDDTVELTPGYDLLSTAPYGDFHMALKLDGRDDNLKRPYLVAFGRRFGVREPAVHALLDEIAAATLPWVARLGEIGLPARKTASLRSLMLKRLRDLHS